MPSNLDALKSLYEGDRKLFFERLAADYVCHTPGGSQIAGRFVGPKGMIEHGLQMRALTDGTFKVSLRAPIVLDDLYALAPVSLSARRGEKVLAMHAFGIWRFDGDRIVEHWENPVDMRTFDAFWAN